MHVTRRKPHCSAWKSLHQEETQFVGRSCRDTPSPCIDQERHLRTRKLDRNGECGIVSRRRIDRGEELPARNRYIGGVLGRARALQGRRNVAQG